jgi:uncharacterized membrane protein YraQ (UPF0718 family)
VPVNVVVAFLTATQSAGLDSAAITWGLLGPRAALCRLGGATILSIASGLAVPSALRATAKQAASISTDSAVKGSNPGHTFASAFGVVISTAEDVFPSVLLGLCLSTAALHFAPQLATTYAAIEVSGALMGPPAWLRSLLTRLAVLVAALPLQLCEHSTVAYAAAIQKAGGPPGLAFAFLLAAPATNLPSLVLLLKASSGRAVTWSNVVVWRVAATLTLGALALSYVVDFLQFDLLVEKEADEGGATMLELPSWFVMASRYAAAALSVAIVARWVSSAFGKEPQHACPDCDTHKKES